MQNFSIWSLMSIWQVKTSFKTSSPLNIWTESSYLILDPYQYCSRKQPWDSTMRTSCINSQNVSIYFCLNFRIQSYTIPDHSKTFWITFGGIWRRTTLDKRRPLMEDVLRWKTTFDRVYSILPEKNVYNSSPWQPQHNWPQTGNLISCLNRK